MKTNPIVFGLDCSYISTTYMWRLHLGGLHRRGSAVVYLQVVMMDRPSVPQHVGIAHFVTIC